MTSIYPFRNNSVKKKKKISRSRSDLLNRILPLSKKKKKKLSTRKLLCEFQKVFNPYTPFWYHISSVHCRLLATGLCLQFSPLDLGN